MTDFDRVDFKTLDGVTLRGNYFRADRHGAPIIVMTQGLTLLKEHYIDDSARRFQAAGISALVYDHRSYGSSEGTPRHQTDPLQQAEDYHDAVSAAMALPGVDPSKIGIWGIGHSGGAVMIAGGDDPRVSVVVCNMPFISGARDAKGFPAGILERAWKDRQDAVTRAGRDVTYVQPWPLSLANAEGRDGERTFLTSEHAFKFFNGSKERSDAAGTPWDNRMTLQSFYYLAKAEPQDFIGKIAPRHFLYLAAEEDPLTAPLEVHRKLFEKTGPNAKFAVLRPHHLATYFGDAFEASIGTQIEFLDQAFSR